MSRFRDVLRDADNGAVLKPLLHSYLFEAEWPEDFSITFKKGSNRREPDGWFHPSEHVTWPERLLWFLITQPDAMIPEQMEYQGTLSVTMGTAMHGFIETCLKHLNLLATGDELRAMGFDVNPQNGEPSVADHTLGSRGHMDGVLKNLYLPNFPGAINPLFEFKSSNNQTLSKMDDLDLDAFIEKWPGYYGQAQDYLRMSSKSVSVVLFMGMGYPWTLREFHIPLNAKYARDIARKYQNVRDAAETGEMPMPCCKPGSATASSCPARAICPVANQ